MNSFSYRGKQRGLKAEDIFINRMRHTVFFNCVITVLLLYIKNYSILIIVPYHIHIRVCVCVCVCDVYIYLF
jgi:hypothetical protein